MPLSKNRILVGMATGMLAAILFGPAAADSDTKSGLSHRVAELEKIVDAFAIAPVAEERLDVTDVKLIATVEEMKRLVAILLLMKPDELSNFTIEVTPADDVFHVQFFDELTGEDIGCHDIDNMQSCQGSCPCSD